ncbi:MAG: ArgR family transcriptional regulator [Actinobacteria bacterium]|nr:MAG: ArgR family transcriptional regulator [Actinomycetota bacterium]
MGAKERRQQVVKEIVRSAKPSTQADVARMLLGRGFDVTQTTVSRDLAELNVHKGHDGAYELAEDTHLKRMCRDLVVSVERSANLVVVKASAGTAQGVAAALDGAAEEGILGSVAGDDTILVVASDEVAGERLRRMLGDYCGKDK